MQPRDPFHTLNTLSSAQVSELAASTPEKTVAAFGAHRRTFPDPALDVQELTRPFLFRDLPGRMDAGTDDAWDKVSHRFASAWRGHRTERRDRRFRYRHPRRVSSAVYVRGPVSGAMRGLVFAVLLEAAAVVAIIGFVIARKLY